jgi:hypothetical protein
MHEESIETTGSEPKCASLQCVTYGRQTPAKSDQNDRASKCRPTSRKQGSSQLIHRSGKTTSNALGIDRHFPS